jgi:membrane-bound lytic murein transglycosylase MltF
MELPINTTDKEEVGNFAHVLGNYNAIKTELLTLQDSIGEGLDFDDMLPLRIKESRLQSTSTSKTGAVGLGQLQPAAIADVNRRLKKHNFTATYTPKDNPAHNLLYSTIYLSLIKQQVKDFLEAKKVEVSDTDLFLFTIASYNL